MVVRLVPLLLGLGVLPALLAGSNIPAASAEVDTDHPGRLILDDPLQPLVPRRPRTEAEEDHIESLALFAAARAHELRQEYAEALRDYQRAFRVNPQSITIARAILPLAYRLKRYGEAGRYALKAVQLEHADPMLLRRLGVYLTEEGDWSQAVALYEQALAAGDHDSDNPKDSPSDILLRMEMGRLYHLIEQYDKAADCFSRVSDALDHPDKFGLDEALMKVLLGKPGLTYNLFGECYLLADRPDAARAAFEKAHQLAPNQGRLDFNLARVDAHRNEPAKALKRLQSCFDEHLDDEGMVPYELLGEVLEKLGRKDQWTGQLETLRDDDPENVPLGYALAARYLETEDFQKAESLYRELIAKSPTLTGYRSLVDIYHKTARPEPLLETLGEALMKTGSLDSLGGQARAVAHDEPLLGRIIETARKRYEADPPTLDYGMRFAVALLAMEGKQPEVAGEFFDLAIEADPDQAAELLLLWGVGLLMEERSAEAADVFRRAIDDQELAEDAPTFYHYLAGALTMDDRIDEAVAAARKAVSLKKDSAEHLSRLAWVYYYGKRNNDAIRVYRDLIKRFDSDTESPATRDILREARLVLSNLYVLQGDLDEAEEWLEQVLDEFPDDIGAANDLGYLWADQGKYLHRALRMIRFAVDAEPDNMAYRDSLGWVYYRLGRYDEAVAELQKAVATVAEESEGGTSEENGPDGVILDHLGDAYWAAGRTDDAKDTWRRAVDAFRKNEETEKMRATEEKLARDHEA
ncbi:MAG TPA: tetratricopeptide repeat protein [Thermoguttaceae bacterium]|nr:tetratricopeptide repeat protein [Thermoguttaceae bacterium]